ncbi:MAG TPA: hypothetical protein VI233_15360 [Puia sp.]
MEGITGQKQWLQNEGEVPLVYYGVEGFFSGGFFADDDHQYLGYEYAIDLHLDGIGAFLTSSIREMFCCGKSNIPYLDGSSGPPFIF